MSLNLTATKFTSLRWGKSQLGGKEGSSGREREREKERQRRGREARK